MTNLINRSIVKREASYSQSTGSFSKIQGNFVNNLGTLKRGLVLKLLVLCERRRVQANLIHKIDLIHNQ